MNVAQAFSYAIDNVLALLMTFINISAFVSFTKLPFLPSYLVFSIGFYTNLAHTIGFNFTQALSSLMSALVSLKRINDFLVIEELPVQNRVSYYGNVLGITVESFSFNWNIVS